MKIGFYAGSFDPFTKGHLRVVKGATKLFDKVIIGIAVNTQKTRNYDRELMKCAIEKVLQTEGITNAEVIHYDHDLTVNIAVKYNAMFLIRGLRNETDYDYEETISAINEDLAGLDTIYLRAGEFGFVSSSMVMELLHLEQDVSKYVPNDILEIL